MEKKKKNMENKIYKNLHILNFWLILGLVWFLCLMTYQPLWVI